MPGESRVERRDALLPGPRKRTDGAPRWFWIEAGLAVGCSLLLAATALWPAWIEAVTGVDPDNSSGTLEWSIVFALAASTIAFSVLARREWRKHRTA
jgi:hypothetical protein